MTPAEITRMLKQETTNKFGHEQMTKKEYKRMLWLMRHRSLEQDIYNRLKYNTNTVNPQYQLSKQAVIGDTNALAFYHKHFPKCYAISLKMLNSNTGINHGLKG